MLRLDYYRVYSEQVHECNIYEEPIYRYLFLTLVIDKLTLSKYVNVIVSTLQQASKGATGSSTSPIRFEYFSGVYCKSMLKVTDP